MTINKHFSSIKVKWAILALLFIFTFFSFQTLPLFKSVEDKAKLYHYKSIKWVQKGKRKKAINALKKAILLDRKNEYLIDLANLYAKEDQLKKAFNTVRKVAVKDNSPPINKVELLAWKGYYAISIGERFAPFESFNNAIQLMKRYKIDSTQLMSNLYNNSAVSRLFYNDQAGKGNLRIHYRDFEQSQQKLQTALSYNPENCVAQYNLDFVETILEVPQDSLGMVRYVTDSLYDWRQFPELNCIIPPPPPHEEILTTLNKEKEVVFVLDISGSMSALTPSGKSRFQAMKDLVLSLLDDLDEEVEIGLITLGQDCQRNPIRQINVGDNNYLREDLKRMVRNLSLNGSTPLNNRLHRASNLFSRKKREKAIFLCSDGLNTCGNESTCKMGDRLRSKGIKVFAFSLLLESSSAYQEYAIYDCITKATYGELLGITETEDIQVKTTHIRDAVYPLALKMSDLLNGKFEDLVPQDSILAHKPKQIVGG